MTLISPSKFLITSSKRDININYVLNNEENLMNHQIFYLLKEFALLPIFVFKEENSFLVKNLLIMIKKISNLLNNLIALN